MKIVVDVPDEEYESYALAITFGMGSTAIRRILNGTPLPEGAEILTAEAYSDLCLRASHERKTGRWIEHDDFDNSWECSVCNEVVDIIEGTPMDNEYRFCPWCGAKMEGAEE